MIANTWLIELQTHVNELHEHNEHLDGTTKRCVNNKTNTINNKTIKTSHRKCWPFASLNVCKNNSTRTSQQSHAIRWTCGPVNSKSQDKTKPLMDQTNLSLSAAPDTCAFAHNSKCGLRAVADSGGCSHSARAWCTEASRRNQIPCGSIEFSMGPSNPPVLHEIPCGFIEFRKVPSNKFPAAPSNPKRFHEFRWVPSSSLGGGPSNF